MRSICAGLSLLTVICLTISACKEAGNIGQPIDLNAIEKSSDSNEVKAEKMAQAGETIAMGPNFMDAYKIMDRALALDSKNQRAQLWRSIITPAMLTQGIMVRVQPFVAKLDKKDQEGYKNAYRSFTTIYKDTPVAPFLFDGKQDITTEDDFQNYILSVHRAAVAAENMIASLRDVKMTLRPYNFGAGLGGESVLKNCKATLVDGILTPYTCEGAFIQEWQMDFADWEAMKLLVMTFDYEYTGFTAFDARGGYQVYRDSKDSKTDQQKVSVIQRQADLGQLLHPEILKEIHSAGVEGVEAMKMAAQNESDLCKAGNFSPGNRPNNFVSYGWCVDGNTRGWTDLVGKLLTGPTELAFKAYSEYEGLRWQSGKYRTTVNVTKFFDGNITKLQSILPDKFTKEGKAATLPDGGVGGVFPGGDAVKVIRTQYPDLLPGVNATK